MERFESAVSDHFPIITSLDLTIDSPPQNMRSSNLRKANWNRFTEYLETCTQMTASKDLEILIQKFILGVQKAAKASIPRGRRKNNWMSYWRDHNIDELIRERDAASHELEKNNKDETRRNLIDISRE
ncbi:hypothetical protein TNCT_203671 [Trichonephila clavata]|uniref:Uncharacterized protein n=1 Tax=Trichonephila clavata TaxID=2740835 RepID=A0A8X6F2Q4_TRICU|nr:hypothetical protein TNCT_203671 [Trichonephila clavata]